MNKNIRETLKNLSESSRYRKQLDRLVNNVVKKYIENEQLLKALEWDTDKTGLQDRTELRRNLIKAIAVFYRGYYDYKEGRQAFAEMSLPYAFKTARSNRDKETLKSVAMLLEEISRDYGLEHSVPQLDTVKNTIIEATELWLEEVTTKISLGQYLDKELDL